MHPFLAKAIEDILWPVRGGPCKVHDQHGLTGSSWNEERAKYLAEGKLVRHSALAHPNGLIHVLFIKRDVDSPILGESAAYTCDEFVGVYMKKSTYEAFPMLEVTTLDQFKEIGFCIPAPDGFEDTYSAKRNSLTTSVENIGQLG